LLPIEKYNIGEKGSVFPWYNIILIFNQAFSNTLLTCTLSKIQLRADSENLFIIIVEKMQSVTEILEQ